MSYWLGQTLRHARSQFGITEEQMATSLDVNWRTIRRLETGLTVGRDIDRAVAGYAYVVGVDARDLWADALARWVEDGSVPQFEPMTGPAAAFARAIRDEAVRTRAEGARAPVS